jgi:transcriptional regulator with XRE-family HTH domain
MTLLRNNNTHLNSITPAQQAKAAGLKSLLQVSELTGVSIQTLSNWAKNKPELFRVVISGVVKEIYGH